MKTYNKSQAFRRFVVFAALPLAIFTLVFAIPFVRGIIATFQNSDAFDSYGFVGFDNYVTVFNNGEFWRSLGLTTLFTLLTVVLVNIVAFGLALLVTIPVKGVNALRTMFFLPNLIGGVILGMVWQFMFSKVLPVVASPIFSSNWLLKPWPAFFAMVIVTIWQLSGYLMIIYVTALTGVPTDVLEAAKIDGATGWRQLVYVKLPLIAPAFTISLFLTIRSAFMAYDLNLSLTGGGPYGQTQLLSLHILNEAYQNKNFGSAQTEAIIMFVIVALATILQVRISKRFEVEA